MDSTDDIAPTGFLIGELQSPSVLMEEYQNADRPGFVPGVVYLTEKYGHIRRVRGDGNCFYRAFLFSYLEELIKGNKSDNSSYYQEERVRMLSLIVASKEFVVSMGYSEFVIESFHEALVELLENLFDYSSEQLLNMFQDDMTSNTYTWYMRLLTASSLKKNAEEYLPFISDMVLYGNDMASYCSKEVEPMGKECEQVHIMALLEVLQGVEINIEYLDGRPLTAELSRVNLHSKETPSGQGVILALLYRPGHYDILYI